MSINISAFAGAGAQFFDANGVPLSGGLIYTYLAGTTTNALTYTSRTGTFNNTNPIVLDSAGRTPAEIWMDGGSLYKFVLKDSTFVQIGSYDNIPAINDVTSINSLITVAGTNTLTGLATPLLAAYTAGAQFSFVAQNTNTGAVTLDIDTLGAKSVTKYGTTALIAGDLIAGSIALIEYDGTRFQLINPASITKLTTSIKTTSFAAISSNTYAVNTTAGAITATLPASPAAGDYVTFTDYARTFTTNNLTINPNGGKINASTSNVILNVSGEAVSLVYIDATQGWLAYSGFTSNPTTNYLASYLVVAGGGGGGGSNGTNSGGGGGAGGLLTGSTTLTSGTAYTITIGAGGASGLPGSNSSFSTIAVSLAGGSGGAQDTGGNGGSGGGARVTAGVGTLGQGNNGGTGASTTAAGGGGGAGAVGGASVGNIGGAGGVGASSTISGSAAFYGGGGGGGAFTTGGTGGSGGGGNGSSTVAPSAGTINTGGGGGGSGVGGGAVGGAGGSGIVIISYVGTQRGTGGTVTSVGGNTIHTFTSSGTYIA